MKRELSNTNDKVSYKHSEELRLDKRYKIIPGKNFDSENVDEELFSSTLGKAKGD